MVTANQKCMIDVYMQEIRWNSEKTLKTVIKSQEKGKKDLQKQNQQNGNKSIYINSYLKCKWIKCFNQKTYSG